jgi:hypothetical protein
MRRRWFQILAISLVLLLAGGELAEAQKSRKSRRQSRASVKKSSRAKINRSRSAKVRRGSAARIARGRRGRGSRRGRVARSRRSNQYLPNASAADMPRPPSSSISSERATEIQNALIKLGYLQGPASTQYDDKTIEAMKQFQADNKLQQTGYPSAHTLKKLGVSKRGTDSYAVPVGSVIEKEKKPAPIEID